jgi:hypothetical protein
MPFSRSLPTLLCVAALVAPAAFAEPAGRSLATRANIYVIASKSFCAATGISDAYTGNGKVGFYLVLRNSGFTAGKVNIVPVRHYDDGEFNASALDMLIDVRVQARAVRRIRSPLYTYKAHEHEVAACGVKINNRPEIRIKAIHL